VDDRLRLDLPHGSPIDLQGAFLLFRWEGVELPEQLRAEFEERQAAEMVRLAENQRRQRLQATLAGGAAGLVAVVLTATVTRREIFWHSFLFETVFCAIAGHVLARLHGGHLWGVLLFSGAYLLAFGLRLMGLDPSVIFQTADIAAVGAAQGNLTSLAFLILVGGAFGHIFEG
jgi:hypothetical protein